MNTEEKKYVVGVDVGGQTTKIGVVDKNGVILAGTVIRTDTYEDFDGYSEALAEAVRSAVRTAGVEGQVKGVGVGAPNGNYYEGTMVSAVNIEWAKGVVPFAQVMSRKLGGLPVSLTNDANAAAMGEMAYGVARGMKNFIMLTLGTGVGSGIVVNGELLYGSDGFAGELGHTCAVRGGRKCNCGKEGCLEAYCSAVGVAKTAREWLEMSDEPSLLRNEEEINSKTVYDAAKKGDALAVRILEYTGRILGRSAADFVAFSAPEAIVFFGGLARSREFLEKAIVDSLNENLMFMWKGKVKVLFSSLKESDAAILGASALAW